jgi:hypothetical protein
VRGRFGSPSGLWSPSAIATLALLLVAAGAGGTYALLAKGPPAMPGATTAGAGKAPVAAATGATIQASGVTAARPSRIPTVVPTPKPRVGATGAKTTTAAAPGTPTSAATPPAPATTTTGETPRTSAANGAASADAVKLADGAVQDYNPYGAVAGRLGNPAKATDGDPLTAWTYKLDPATDGATKVGLAIRLTPAEQVSRVTLATASPGMSVELYGAQGQLPATITAPGWLHLASRADIDPDITIDVNPEGKKFDYLLVWITHAPTGVNAGDLSISELSVDG